MLCICALLFVTSLSCTTLSAIRYLQASESLHHCQKKSVDWVYSVRTGSSFISEVFSAAGLAISRVLGGESNLADRLESYLSGPEWPFHGHFLLETDLLQRFSTICDVYI